MFLPNVYSDRRSRLRRMLNSGVAVFLGNQDSPMNYPANPYHFRQDSSFLYFFGLNYAGMAAIVDIDEGRDILFADDTDIEDIIWMGPQPAISELGHKAGISDTRPWSGLGDYIRTAANAGRKIHFLPPYRPDNRILLHQMLNIPFDTMKASASLEFVKAVVALRSVKDEFEVGEIEKACNIGGEMHVTSMKAVRPGKFEREISGLAEGIALQHGSSVSFPVICSVRGETLHNHYHGNVMKDGDLLLLDAGAETTMNYCSDYTRVVPVNGKFTQKQREIYEIVLRANEEGIRAVKPGITYKSVHLMTCRIIAEGLKDLGLMCGNIEEAVNAGAHAMFFPHGLGHMMGLDVHDMEDLGQINVGYDDEIRPSEQFGTAYLRLGKRLGTGYVLTVEPGIYFIPALIGQWKAQQKFRDFINYDKVMDYIGFGGIRIEDDVLVTENGHRLLGKPVPKKVEEIHALFA